MNNNSVMITPDSDIILLKVPFEMDNENELTFTNATAQYNYFSSLSGLELENATYQRKDGVLRWAGSFDDIVGYNYCMYQNTHFSNKWFYAFIEDIKFENPNMTSIKLKTDVFQTWQFDIVYKKMFVEREHVNDDTVGKNILPENLETGEMICNSYSKDSTMDSVTSDLTYVVSSAINLWIISAATDKYVSATPTQYNGILSGTQYFRFDTASDLQTKLQDVSARGQIEAINGLFMAPKSLCTLRPNSTTEIASSSTCVSHSNTITKQTTIDGYTPKNNKLLTGQFNYLMVSNNNGGNSIYFYEDFSTTNCVFDVDMCLTAGCSIRMIPKNYKRLTAFNDFGMNLGKLPICSYVCDMYTNWLTQNSINVPLIGQVSSDTLNIASGVVSTLGSAIGGNISGTASGVLGIGNALIQKNQHELIPPQSRGNLNAGDVITATDNNTFHFYKMSVKRVYAEIIDDFFSAYGYQVNSYKIPNITGRTNWNYVKTINCNIVGDIPQKDLQELKSIFNNGVTFWHNPTTFLDYSQSNTIVT